MIRFAYAALPVIAAFAAPAAAATYSVSGDTTGSPTYTRVLAGTPPTSLSSVGTAVRYDVVGFTVDFSGSYSLFTTSGFDAFLTLYAGSFDPNAALTNALSANDDGLGSFGDSLIVSDLLAGTSYFAVVTGFSNSDFGAYTLTIEGPGNIGPIGGGVPEPATWAMMIAGFGMMGAGLRHRRHRTAVAFG